MMADVLPCGLCSDLSPPTSDLRLQPSALIPQPSLLPLKFIRAPAIIAVYHIGKKKDEKMIDTIKRLFKHKHTTPLPTGEGSGVGLPLRIEGVKPAPLTPEPDDAELAAQALLESMCDVRSKKEDGRCKMEDVRSKMEDVNHQSSAISHHTSKSHHPSKSHHTSEYYHALADRIRTARSAEARLTMRLLASVEEQLAEPTALYKGQWGDTEHKLYRAMDIAEREGGELKSRWQHCLANVIVRRMEEEREEMYDG